jgi:tRNA U34 5-methylaminomethyl-2-thiouridine-forming methyltransferase MnmC
MTHKWVMAIGVRSKVNASQVSPGNAIIPLDHPTMSNWLPQPTADGSYTFFSETFGEAFHSRVGAKAEALEKFSQATHLQEKAQRQHLALLDVCYGLGYNSAAALETIWRVNPHCQVTLYGLELDATVPIAATQPLLLQSWTDRVQVILQALAQQQAYQDQRLTAHLLIGDARQTIQTLIHQGFCADAIFFDPFSPRRCPQLWTVEFFQAVAQCLQPDGKLSTYSRSAAVRSALLQAGLQIGTVPLAEPHLSHEWAQGTIAAWQTLDLIPLSVMEQEHLQTRAAIPYRDATLQDSAEVILARHAQAQRSAQVESTSSWRKRWGLM